VGAALFMFAEVLDTTDRWFLPWLRGVADRLTTQPPRLLSDTWYLLWAPKRTFNTVEEVLENMAAAVFAAAVMVLLFERRSIHLPARMLAPRPRASAVLGIVLAVACVGAVAWGRPSLWASSPALDRPARRLVGAETACSMRTKPPMRRGGVWSWPTRASAMSSSRVTAR
jgi:hypothetical protein